MIVDLFAGPGGWDEGLATLGVHDVVGIEWDQDACLTAAAAGHRRVRADVAAYPTAPFIGKTSGLIASPPCQAFSSAGHGKGRDAIADLLAHVWACRDGWVPPDASLCVDDVRADLTMQPLRWVHDLRPEWIALEQVPPALPLWQAIAQVLTLWGYSAVTAVLNAADYGVPQTRKRAILVASRAATAQMPEPTHFDPRKGASLFGRSWVSMAEALGWTGDVDRRTNSKDGRGGMVPTVPVPTDRPAPTVTGKAEGQWVLRNNNQERACVRPLDQPAGTIFVGNNLNRIEWCYERPATTVVGSFRPDIIAGPGWRAAGDGPRQNAEGSVKVTQAELGVLQSFRRDYPWQGTKTSQGRQVGNAVPPVLAAAVLTPLVENLAAKVA